MIVARFGLAGTSGVSAASSVFPEGGSTDRSTGCSATVSAFGAVTFSILP
jgi:hypothetical protein